MKVFLAATVFALGLTILVLYRVTRDRGQRIRQLEREYLLAQDHIRDLTGEAAELSGVIGAELDSEYEELT